MLSRVRPNGIWTFSNLYLTSSSCSLQPLPSERPISTRSLRTLASASCPSVPHQQSRESVKIRTLWLAVGFIFLACWAIVNLRDGTHLVLFCCAMGLLVYLIEKFVKA